MFAYASATLGGSDKAVKTHQCPCRGQEIARSRDHAKAHNRDNIDKFWKLGYGCAPSTEGVLPWYAQESTSHGHTER
eukprot:1162527-Pyramimonas_sp.AAC.1